MLPAICIAHLVFVKTLVVGASLISLSPSKLPLRPAKSETDVESGCSRQRGSDGQSMPQVRMLALADEACLANVVVRSIGGYNRGLRSYTTILTLPVGSEPPVTYCLSA